MGKSSECGFQSFTTYYYNCMLFTQGYKCVPASVELDNVYAKATGAPPQFMVVYSPGSRERLKECFWPNDFIVRCAM